MTRRNDAGGRAAETDGALQVMNASREPVLLNSPKPTSAIAAGAIFAKKLSSISRLP